MNAGPRLVSNRPRRSGQFGLLVALLKALRAVFGKPVYMIVDAGPPNVASGNAQTGNTHMFGKKKFKNCWAE